MTGMAGRPQATVGFVGLGNMGWPMARNLARAKRRLIVHDAAPGRAEAFAGEVGCEAAGTLATLAERAVFIITMLPDGHAVRDAVTGGSSCLLGGMHEGSILIDMGSSDPRIYQDLAPALACRGAHLIDAPVSGGVKGAKAASLAIMAGGEPAVIDRIEPLLTTMGARLFRTGPLGSGQAMKALNNLASAGALALTIEVLLIGQRFGLDAKLMTEILNVSTGRNNSTEKKIIPHVLSRRFDSGFALTLMAKDLTTALGLAQATRTPAALSAQVLEIAERALDALGPGADHTALARYIEAAVGEELQPDPKGDRGDQA
jgi:3-hydroxyisobutyrate dehydrogenase